MANVSAIAVENGPIADFGSSRRRDDDRVGAIGWREKVGGDEGGVRPDPEGGSSVVGDGPSGAVVVGGWLEVDTSGDDEVCTVDPAGASTPPSRSREELLMRWSRRTFRIDIPYGE
jgi:hypothetical protein